MMSNIDIVLAQLRDVEEGLWIGMRLLVSDIPGDEPWLWVDNSHVSYTNWLSGKPVEVKTIFFNYSELIINIPVILLCSSTVKN